MSLATQSLDVEGRMWRRAAFAAFAHWLALAAEPGVFGAIPPESEGPFAHVVDSPLWPDEAAAVERIPLRYLLAKLRYGPEGRTLGRSFDPLAARDTHATLMREGERFRGSVVNTGLGVLVDIARVESVLTGPPDPCDLYAGVLAAFDVRRGLEVRLWAFRALRRRGDPMLYPGDRVHVDGYFLKRTCLVDAKGALRWMPLVISPWPTLSAQPSGVPKWAPLAWYLQAAPSLSALLPLAETPHREVRSRLVLVARADGTFRADGIAFATEDEAVAAAREVIAPHPERAVVAAAEEGRGDLVARARAVLARAGAERIAELPAPP
jgi:hypothetical protein